jgi:hypothetical protein
MFDFEKYWEKYGVHTKPEIIGMSFKEVAKKAVDVALAEITPLIPVKPRTKYIRKAFNKNGEEVPYAIEEGDFTWHLPEGYTLKKEKNHGRKRNTHA